MFDIWPSRGPLRAALLAAFLMLAASCSYGVKFVDTGDGGVAYGDYNTFTKKIDITLPSAGRFKGKYFPLDQADLGSRQGSLFSRIDVSTYLGFVGPAAGWEDMRALLRDGPGGTIEVIFRFNSSRSIGYGIARAAGGGEWRVSLGETAARDSEPAKSYDPFPTRGY